MIHKNTGLILKYCKEHRIKITELRKQVINILAKSNQAASAYEILNELKTIRPNAEPMTVYRVLDFLHVNNIIHKLEAQKKYILCCHPDVGVCQIFICTKCNTKYEVHDVNFNSNVHKLARTLDFNIKSSTIEFYGTCQNCS